MKSIDDLFQHFLQDVYYAECQLVKALPKMEKSAEAPAIKAAFAAHCTQTKQHVERLEKVFAHLGKPVKAIVCEAIKGLIEEADEVITESSAGPVRDAGLIACGQAVEHYEMARYTSLIAWATFLEHPDVISLLRQTLGDEIKAETALGALASSTLGKHGAKAAAAV